MDPPTPGTAAYFPSVLTRIRDAHPDLPLDPVIVQSLLLCLVAGADDEPSSHISSHGSKNLVLRTREEDVGLVLNITEVILTEVFGFPTHKRRVRHPVETAQRSNEFHARTHDSPDIFLRHLFLRGKHGSRWSLSELQRSRRTGSARGPLRAASYPPPGLPVAETIPLPSVSSHSRETTDESEFDVTSLASSRRLFVTPASTLRLRPQAPRTQTDPPPETAITVAQRLGGQSPKLSTIRPQSSGNISLPKALVLSGLEHAGIPAQRALVQVLHDRRLILDAYDSEDGVGRAWNLPDDFIMVFVCPIDPNGRPPVLRTLLDRFAMSVDIVVTPAVRQAYRSYRSASATPLSASFNSSTPRTPLSPLRPYDTNAEAPPTPPPLLRGTSQAVPGSPAQQPSSPVIPPHELAYLRTLTPQAPAALPPLHQVEAESLPDAYTSIHPSLRLYLADLFSATRHHPLLDGTMLTLRAYRDAEDLARAFRVISGSTIGAELVVEVAAMATNGDAGGNGNGSVGGDSDGGLRTPGDEDSDSLDWGKSPGEDQWLGDELRMSKRKASSVRSIEVRVQIPEDAHPEDAPFGDGASSVENGLRTGFSPPLARLPEVWDVSEVDIAKIFPRVVSHRVRMRSGPDDEILGSIMFPAVPVSMSRQSSTSSDGDQRDDSDEQFDSEKTVKQVLISILADV